MTSGHRDARPGSADPDRPLRQAILALVLEVHPAQRSLEELLREMTDDPTEVAARVRVEDAVRDLVGAGLLHRHGSFVFATNAAVHFDELKR